MTKEKIEIVIAGEQDNLGLIELSHNCPMESDISLYPDRTPDYSIIQKTIDKDSYHSIARTDKKVIGCLGCTYIDLQVNKKAIKAGIIADFKVLPEYRKSMITYRVVKLLSETEKSSKADLWIGLILANNQAPLPFIMGRVGFPETIYIGRYDVKNYIPLRKLKVNPDFEILPATKNDIPEMAEVYMKFYNNHQLTPFINEKILRDTISDFKGLEIENFIIARKNGKIRAVMALWDQSFYKRLVIQEFHMGAKILIFLCRILSIFTKIPKLPKAKNHLKVMNIVMTAHDNSPEAFKALVRFINNKFRGGNFPILTYYLRSDSPLKKCMKGLHGTTVSTDCYVGCEDEEIKKSLMASKNSIHLEWQIFL